jgi:hypothetical protein
MEAIRSSITEVFTRATRRNIPEDGILHSHRRENRKPYIELRNSYWPHVMILHYIAASCCTVDLAFGRHARVKFYGFFLSSVVPVCGSHRCVCVLSCLLLICTFRDSHLGRNIHIFSKWIRGRILSSGMLRRVALVRTDRLTFLVYRVLSPWWWRRYIPPKRRFIQEPRYVTSKKKAFFIVTAVKTSTLTLNKRKLPKLYMRWSGLENWD